MILGLIDILGYETVCLKFVDILKGWSFLSSFLSGQEKPVFEELSKIEIRRKLNQT